MSSGRLMYCLVIVAVALSVAPVLNGAERAVKSSPRAGVKTPGVHIPFASLVPETEISVGQGNPGWEFFSAFWFVPTSDSIVRIDAKTNKTVDPISGLSQPCGGMANGFGSLWAPQCGSGTLARIDPKTLKISATIASGAGRARESIVATADSIWLITDDKTTLSRIDPDQNVVVGEIRLPAGCQSLILADKSLWIACPSRNRVLRINAATNVVEQSIEVAGQPSALAAGAEGSVWALCRKDGKVERIDTKTNKAAKSIDLGVPDTDGSIAYGEGWLWVSQKGFPLARIDTKQETVMQQFHGAGGGGPLVASNGALFLGTARGVMRIDPKRVLATLSDE